MPREEKVLIPAQEPTGPGPQPNGVCATPSPVLSRRGRSLERGARVLLALVLAGTLLAPTACMVRSDRPVLGPDSTLVFPSRLRSDVNASITFALRDSRAREEERQRDKERQREISRLKREREKLLDLAQAQEKERARQAKIAAEKKRKAEEKAKAKTKKSKAGKDKKSSKKKSGDEATGSAKMESGASGKPAEPARPNRASEARGGPEKAKPDLFALTPAAIRDSLAAIDARLRRLAVEDSLAQPVRWKLRKAQGLYEDERAFDLEEDARVLATVRLENIHARGEGPLTFHLVWLNPAERRVFKKIYEYTPNDSTRTLTGSFSIPPSRRSPGFYTLQVFLFRELIAQKSFELRGAGLEVPEGGGGTGM